MKKFFKNAQESMTVGLKKLDAKVVGHKIEEDPEYIELDKRFNEVSEKYDRLRDAVNQINQTFKDDEKVFLKLNDVMNNVFGEGKGDFKAVTSACNNVSTNLYPEYVQRPLNDALNQLKNLNDVKKKRKDALILYQDAQSKLEHHKSQNKDTTSIEEEVNTKKQKYEELHKQFMDGTNEIYAAREETCKKIYAGLTYYYTSVNKLISEELQRVASENSVTINESDFKEITPSA